MTRRILSNLALIVPLIVFVFTTAQAQPSAFTYQGKLTDAGSAANGQYDFAFRLFDAGADGTQIGTDVVLDNVQVSGGIFAVNLDFGANAFTNGAPRYLEIAVRSGTSSGAFTILTPRQPITSAPFSIKSLIAASADNAFNLGGLAAGQYVVTTDIRLTDSRNPLPNSPNYIQNTVAPQAASNFNISGNGTAGGTLSGNVVNAATQFNIGGFRVLTMNPATASLSVGGATSDGSNNTFFGVAAGNFNTGFSNAFFGTAAGFLNMDGSVNSFFGTGAGRSNTSGSENSFFGYTAGGSNQTGCCNSFFGRNTGAANISGQLNAFFGGGAGGGNTTGSNNTFIGLRAGESNVGGGNNTMLGYNANVLNGNLSFATAIGAGATVSQNNQIVLGRSSRQDEVLIPGTASVINGLSASTLTTNLVTTGQLRASTNVEVVSDIDAQIVLQKTTGARSSWKIFADNGPGNLTFAIHDLKNGRLAMGIDNSGNVGIGTNAPTDKLEVNGILRINAVGSAGGLPLCRNLSNQISNCSSSLRYKTNIAPFAFGLTFIEKLRPITFDWKAGGAADIGFGAEDVAQISPLFVTFNEKGEIEGVKYDRLSVVFVNAFKEQQTQIERQQKQIDDLKILVCELKPEAAICRELQK